MNESPTKEQWEWMLGTCPDPRKVCGDALEFSPQEKQMMQELEQKNT